MVRSPGRPGIPNLLLRQAVQEEGRRQVFYRVGGEGRAASEGSAFGRIRRSGAGSAQEGVRLRLKRLQFLCMLSGKVLPLPPPFDRTVEAVACLDRIAEAVVAHRQEEQVEGIELAFTARQA